MTIDIEKLAEEAHDAYLNAKSKVHKFNTLSEL